MGNYSVVLFSIEWHDKSINDVPKIISLEDIKMSYVASSLQNKTVW